MACRQCAVVRTDSHLESLHSRMLLAEPLAANRQRRHQLGWCGCLEFCEIALLVHMLELADKRIDLAALRGVYEDIVPVVRESVRRGDAELDLTCGKRGLAFSDAWLSLDEARNKSGLSFEK